MNLEALHLVRCATYGYNWFKNFAHTWVISQSISRLSVSGTIRNQIINHSNNLTVLIVTVWGLYYGWATPWVVVQWGDYYRPHEGSRYSQREALTLRCVTCATDMIRWYMKHTFMSHNSVLRPEGESRFTGCQVLYLWLIKLGSITMK